MTDQVLPARLGVLVSGGGTTLANLWRRIDAGELPAEIVAVVSSRPGARALDLAADRKVPATVVERSACADRAEFGRRITDFLVAHDAHFVVLAGFLQLYPIPARFRGRVLNVHPALVPAFSGKGFYGSRVHEAAIAAGVRVSGCTVHFADDEYDHGPIIVQRTVPVLDDDDATTLAARVFEAECQAYPEALRLLIEGRLEVRGRRVHVRPAGAAQAPGPPPPADG